MQPEHQPPASASTSLLLAVLLVAAVAAGVAVWWYAPWRPAATDPAASANDDLPPDPRLSYAGPFTNVHPSVEFVGDARCADCHVDIARTYSKHPMGRSTVPIRDLASKQPYDAAHRNPFDAKGVRLWIERQGDRIWHHHAMIDDGQKVWEDRQEVHYVVGSGTRGYSYLTEIDGYVFQTGISWYSQKNIWDLSPGFLKVPSPGRPIYVGCLQCHSNRVKEKPGYLMRYETGVFEGYNIGCERCHGPGQKHVELRESGEFMNDPYDKSIVNPAHLPWQLRENVCEQCHLGGERRLPRRGRGWFDYRPGTPLEDFVSIYVKNPDLPGTNKAVSHVEQMRKSRCFIKSPDSKKMGCISCHDPHVRVEPQDVASHFRQRCLNCHQKKGCSEPVAQRVKKVPDDSCITCHMTRAPVTNIAHTAMTDHTVSRRPEDGDGGTRELALGEWPIVHFHRDRVNEKDPERQRDWGQALVRLVTGEMMPKMDRERAVRKGLTLLDEALERHPNDPWGWQSKAMGLKWENRLEEARVAYLKALELQPLHEELLDQISQVELSQRRIDEAKGHLKRLVEVNPFETNYRRTYGMLLAQTGDWAGAGEQARAWMKIEPGSTTARQLWTLSLLETGKREEARKEFEAIRKMKPANLAELEQSFRQRGGLDK